MSNLQPQTDSPPALSPTDNDMPAWVIGTITWPGPVAFGLAAAILAPLALTWTGRPWLGLVLLAGGGLFWWTIMWVARLLRPPHPVIIAPLLIVLAVVLARPLADGPVEFFTIPTNLAEDDATAEQWAAIINREAALVATQKIVVIMLLLAPLSAAVWLNRRTRQWLRLMLLGGIAGLLLLTVLQMGQTRIGPVDPMDRANLAMFAPMPAQHVAAVLTGAAAWLIGATVGWFSEWLDQRAADDDSDDGYRTVSPHLPLAVLSAIVLAGTAAVLLASMLAGDCPWSPWRQTAPWLGIAGGLLLLTLTGRRTYRLFGIGMLLAGLAAAVLLWPPVIHSIRRGGLFGWSGTNSYPLEFPGLLWLIQWRGLAGTAAILAAIVLAATVQLRQRRCLAGQAERFACTGAMVGSWVIALGWLIGPGYVNGATAFLALSLYLLSLPADGQPAYPAAVCRPGKASAGYVPVLVVVVIGAYGLIGMSPMMHEPLWIPRMSVSHDKLLHGVWGLYVTLVCCMAAAPLGRVPAVLVGAVASVGLAVAAEFAQRHVGRMFEWNDVIAYAVAAAAVAGSLLAAPARWPNWWRD